MITSILAQMQPVAESEATGVVAVSRALTRHLDVLNHPDSLTELLAQINLVWAVIFILVGMACVLNGYRWRKIVVVVLAGMSGVWAGHMLGQQVGGGVIAAACLAVLFAVLAWPMLRYSVALFGGLAGAFAGANLWTALELNPEQHNIGALVGLIVIGMLTFMAFRAVVIAMTAIGGSSLLIFGTLASLMHVESLQQGILSGLHNNQLMVPILAASAAAVGAVIQFSGGITGMATLADKHDVHHKIPTPEKKAA